MEMLYQIFKGIGNRSLSPQMKLRSTLEAEKSPISRKVLAIHQGLYPQSWAMCQPVFSICACLVCFPNTSPSQLHVTHEGYSGCLKSSMTHLRGMSGSPRKTYMAQNNMHSSFPPLRKKCFKNAWRETDLSGPHGKCEHLPQPSLGCQEEEERDNQVATSS